MRNWGVLLVLCLTSCGGEQLSQEEQARQDQRMVDMVQQANEAPPPIDEVTPEPILYPEIEAHDLYGAACNYAPGTSLGTRVLAREADAYMKIDDEMMRFAADPGSRELPMGTRSLYSGKRYTLRLQIDGEGEETPSGKRNFEGTITLRDPYGRVVYEGTGLAQCGAG